MQGVRELLENYYSGYEENERLVKDKAHKVEFLTTTKYIDKYIKPGDKIYKARR